MVTALSAVLSVTLVGSFVFCALKFLQAVRRYRKTCHSMRQFPHDLGNVVFGNLLQHPGPSEEGLQYQQEMVTKYPRVYSAWLGPFFPIVLVTHPDTVKIILKTSEPKSHYTYNLFAPWIGDGLLLSRGQKWEHNRRLLAPAFHFDILRPYLSIKNKAADVLLGKLDRYARRCEYFEVFGIVRMFTLDVILKCAFSYETGCQQLGEQHPYIRAVVALSEMAVKRFFQPWLYSDWLYFLTPSGRQFLKHCQKVHAVAEEVIAKRREALRLDSEDAKHKQRYLDFLDILLTARDENGEGLTPSEIRDEVDTFLLAGHDTTTSAISWAMFSLAEHPEIQATCQAEVDELLAGRQTDYIVWEDLSNLPYLTMCIKETLRMYSPLTYIQRELTRDTEIDGHTVPAGCIVNIGIYDVHHNPTVWDHSMEFHPERFREENISARSPFAFIPFSAGPRNCMGQNFAMNEIKLVLARMLHKFTLVLDPNHKVVKSIVMKSTTGIRMKAIPRIAKQAM